ncbi:hypothetical protein [Streptomyces sp. NPDC051180]|uniref:hypothetical protein n=1 Tax=unclassified Streptomyces TaxID=2593676 RepID=UPI00344DE014
MAEVTNEDLQLQIAGIRHYVRKVDGGWLPTTEWLKQKLAPLELVGDMKEKIEDIHKEVVKNPVSEYFEAAGLDGIAAGIEKLYEGEGFGTAFKYWGSTVVGGMVALVIGALSVYLAGKFVGLRRDIQELISRDGLIRGYDENGDLTRQPRTAIEDRERRVARGGGTLADIPQNANFDALRGQLESLNPELEKFNQRAPGFVTNFRKMPSAAKLTPTAEGVDKIAKAVTEAPNASTLGRVAKSLGKITDAVKDANPGHISKVAKAVGKLKLAVDGLDTANIPKAAPLQGAADAAHNLATNTGTLAGKLREFARTVSSLNDELGGAAT